MNIFDDIFSDPDYDQLNNLVRWNGLNRNNNESVAHHSFIVTWFSRIIVEELLPVGNDSFKLMVTTYACFHDFDEMFSGDITHDVKYNSYNGEAMKKLINEFCDFKTKEKFTGNTASSLMLRTYLLGEIDPEAKNIVKLADWLSMAFYVKKEINLGNKDLFEQYDYCALQIIDNCTKTFVSMKKRFGNDFDSRIINDISKLKFSKYGR